MLKSLLTLFCLSLLGFSYAQPKGQPEFETIIQQFFESYQVSTPMPYYLGFERRPDGYYVARKENRKTVATELFYSFQDKSYSAISLFSIRESYNQANAKTDYKEYLRQEYGILKDFSYYPYYGYPGWYNDVIAAYDGKGSLSDWELNALARAYQRKAGSLFIDYVGDGLVSERFDLPPGQNALNQEQVDVFLNLHYKRLDCYRRLFAQNPDYVTPIGPIFTKYSNEVMDGFLLLAFHQNEEVARQVLETNLYDDYLLINARNILQSCPKNAILFVWGDNDTYPLLYVQAMEAYRTDVTLINLSLLNVPRYVSWIYNGPFNAPALQTGLPELFFEETVILQQDVPENLLPSQTIGQLYEDLKEKSKYVELPSYQYPIFMLPTANLKVPVSPQAIHFGGLPLTELEVNLPRITTGATLVQADILFQNDWKRPLCFSLTCRVNEWEDSWQDNLVMEGLVYRVYPDKLDPVRQIGQGRVNMQRSYDLLMNKFKWSKDRPITNDDKTPLHQVNFMAGFYLSKALLDDGQKDKARKALDAMLQYLPNRIYPWKASWVYVMRLYARLDDLDQAKSIGYQLIENYQQGVDAKNIKLFKKYMLDFAELHDLPELADAVEKL